MDQQIFSDGIGRISIIGGVVRMDFVVYSPTEKDAQGQPRQVFTHRIVMGADGFLHSATKILETTQRITQKMERTRVRTSAPAQTSVPSAEPDVTPDPAAAPSVPLPRPFP